MKEKLFPFPSHNKFPTEQKKPIKCIKTVRVKSLRINFKDTPQNMN